MLNYILLFFIFVAGVFGFEDNSVFLFTISTVSATTTLLMGLILYLCFCKELSFVYKILPDNKRIQLYGSLNKKRKFFDMTIISSVVVFVYGLYMFCSTLAPHYFVVMVVGIQFISYLFVVEKYKQAVKRYFKPA